MVDKVDVAQIVLRAESGDDYTYLLSRRTSDGYYEWIGGKAEDGETIEQTAERGDTGRLERSLLQYRGCRRILS